MEILKLAAFSTKGTGGNPAGVAFYDEMPSDSEMLKVAQDLGYSESAFVVRQGDTWRVRYFAPAMEIPFCGYATVALGAILGERFGAGEYKLVLNDGQIRVRAERSAEGMFLSTLYSPETSSEQAPREFVENVLARFGLRPEDLDPAFPIRFAHAGANKHLIIFVRDRKTLAQMKYQFDPVRSLMLEQGIVTISLLWRESQDIFRSRNAFASGGVYEDPATGAAAAALAGYLRDIGWQGKQVFTILQGEDMGMPSRLRVAVSGETRHIDP